MSPEERLEADAPWIALYGRGAYDLAIASTEWVLTMPNPPSQDPVHVSFHAAGGEPQVWPNHAVSCGTAAQKTIAQLERLTSPAMPEAASSGRADKRETTKSPAPRRESRDPRASGVRFVSAGEAAASSGVRLVSAAEAAAAREHGRKSRSGGRAPPLPREPPPSRPMPTRPPPA